MKPIPLSTLHAVLGRLPSLSIGLVGDLFLDRYLELASGCHETSLETGLEAFQIDRIRNLPGALGTVMNNLSALGVGRLLPVTVLGDDGHAFDLRKSLHNMPARTDWIVEDADRLTPTYTKPLRPLAGGHREELNRLDVRTRAPLSEATTSRVCEAIRAVWANCDGMMVLDQVNETNWGVVNDRVRSCLAQLAAASPDKLLFIDSRTHLHAFDFGTVKGNRSEIQKSAGSSVDPSEASRRLARRTRRPVFCTLGEEGMLVARPDGSCGQAPGCPVAGPVDIVGAGDAASSGIVVSLLSGATDIEAAAVGNLVASITVQQLGTTGTASPEQVVARWKSLNEPNA